MAPPVKHVRITADGSSLGNGQSETRAACAAILSCGPHVRAVAAYLGPLTNQQAEIAAAAVALEALNVPCQVTLRSDSRYVVETMSGRFRRKSNHDWWSRLDAAASRHAVTWQWVKGHSGDPEQEAADELAQETARAGSVSQTRLDQYALRFRAAA